MRAFFSALAAMALLQACSTLGSFGSPSSDYRSYLDGHVVETRAFDRGNQTFALKALPVTAELLKLQDDMGRVPVGHPPPPDLSGGKRHIVVAFGTLDGIGPPASDLEFQLAGEKPLVIRGVGDERAVEWLYPFAAHYYRVYWLEFAPNEKVGPRSMLELKGNGLKASLELDFSRS